MLQLIEERQQFLDDMEKLGQGKKYRTIIATEISQVGRRVLIEFIFKHMSSRTFCEKNRHWKLYLSLEIQQFQD